MLSIVNGSVGRGRCGSVFEPRNNAIPDTVGLLDVLPLGALDTRHAGPRISGWRAIIDRDRELCTKAVCRR